MSIAGSVADRVKKSIVEFKPGINLLIGPNGSGKTTIFDLMKNGKTEKFKNSQIDYECEGNGKFISHDFEKDNPRIKARIETTVDALYHFHSHGETTKTTISFLKNSKCKDSIVMLDEPEQALDLDGIKTLIQTLRDCKASQIIVITHSPYLILQPDFNVVELVDGYKEKVKKEIFNLIKEN